MQPRIEIPPNAATLTALIEGLVRVNVWLLRHHSNLPPLMRSGVRYKREPKGREVWQTAPQVFAAGFGDCEDLAAWRCAELRLRGELAAAAVIRRGGERLWHALVRRADGTLEDPSRALGMKGAA